MRWLDVAGAPGSGKSTLCDPLWSPHELPIEQRLPPAKWHDFLNEITRLLWLVHEHPTIGAAWRMNNRSVRKMATVARSPMLCGPGTKHVYVQTGLVQRGLGFGWRLHDMGIDLQELTHYFRLMPVSIGVAVTRCPAEIVEQRNHARKLVKETAHEDRAHMVGLMMPAIEVALEVLNARGVPILEVSTDQPIEQARQEVVSFALQDPFDPEASGYSCQGEVLSAPPWWH